MNPERSKLRTHQSLDQNLGAAHASAQKAGQEFANVEDLLRYDSSQNPVPKDVAFRLNASIAAEPRPKTPWWKALFGS